MPDPEPERLPTVDPSDPHGLVRWARSLPSASLQRVAETVRQVQIERAIASGDHDAIIARAFDVGFGRDGLGVLPWVDGEVIVCPGGLVSKSRSDHRCRFVSVDGVWVWDSGLLLRGGELVEVSQRTVTPADMR